ncbi:hypothetical protein B0H12DRAFT_1004403, partial [Mycena haematopus]
AEDRTFDADSPQQRLFKHFVNGYELRVLRIVVQDPLFPITELTTADELIEAFHDVFKCYRWLFEEARIIHRDISRNNVMCRRIGGKVHGVLNDFDLAVSRDALSDSTSKQRTGTLPYMALDLLRPGPPPLHIYRFDLESLFYVMVCIIYQYHEGKKIEKPPFEIWGRLGMADLCQKKSVFL